MVFAPLKDLLQNNLIDLCDSGVSGDLTMRKAQTWVLLTLGMGIASVSACSGRSSSKFLIRMLLSATFFSVAAVSAGCYFGTSHNQADLPTEISTPSDEVRVMLLTSDILLVD